MDRIDEWNCENSQELIFRPALAHLNKKPELCIKCRHCKKHMETIIDDKIILVEGDFVLTTCVADLADKWHKEHPKSSDYSGLNKLMQAPSVK